MKIVRVSVIIYYLQLYILAVNSNNLCYEAERSQRGYALLNTTFSSKPTDSYPTCLELCLDDPRCISFNFWWSTRQCDLNSWSREICQACYVSASSTYMGMARFKGKKGTLSTVPGLSCKDIKNSEDLNTSGTYWIRPAGSDVSFQGYCDMSAIGKWTRVTYSWIDSTLTGGATLTYSEENNGLAISVQITSQGCGKEEEGGVLTFIKGYWTKIKYTQVFRRETGCWSIFGNTGYGHESVNNELPGLYPFSADEGDSITNQYYMGGNSHEFEGLTKQCNTLETNFWRNPNPSVRYATVTLRRQLTAEKAGIFTGTSCGTPTFKIKDIY
ncbi:uncharacterized protein LOC144666730 [Oculina patagonica]